VNNKLKNYTSDAGLMLVVIVWPEPKSKRP
jgi:hypothetical protein